MPADAEPQEQSSRRPRLGVIIALVIFAGGVLVIIYGYLAKPGWVGSSGKQFWDYLDLLIVPAALALGVYWLNRRQTERDQQAEDAQQERALAVESQRAQDEALQAYLDGMSRLLTDKDQPLHRAQTGDSLSTVARARTLTVLPRLDGTRKASVLQFLHESGLIRKERLVLDLGNANLRNANLREADLREANLVAANLIEANLIEANLIGANLIEASLHRADLRGADLREADLRGTTMPGARLGTSFLPSLVRPPRAADLRGADLRQAYLAETNLTGANLREADLRGAMLSRAILSMAIGFTNEELAQQTNALEGATMPNGQKYEDWLKDKKAREKGG